ncbi:hypothetical protein PINS_up015535 [Pythium insidiosum]|nr:hypothetical protein PINS_up015535 [Pythium insidiosum]
MEGELLTLSPSDPKKLWVPLTLRADDISASLLAFTDAEQLQLKWKTPLTGSDVATPVPGDPKHDTIPDLDTKSHCFYVHSTLADGRDDWRFFCCPDDATKKSWEYLITCHCEVDSRVAARRLSKEWHVWHRFSEFEALHEALKSTLGAAVATVPFVKHRRDALRSWLGSSLDEGFLEERRLQLDAYLRRVCAIESAVDFFKPHASVHLKTFFSFDEHCEDVRTMGDLVISERSAGEGLHEFGALNTLLLVIILGLCIVCAYLIKEYRFYYLPESGAAILLGLIVGACARIFYPSRKEMEFLRFNKLLFYFLLLPPIIFEAGYSLHRKRFFSNFNTILLFAVLGTMVSTFIIGFLTFYAGKWGWISIDTSSPLEALLFGALISAVDPVATLSILGNPELNLDPLLYSLVFGESVLNDAVAIVLFNTFLKFYESQSEFTTGAIASLMVEFVFISLGSVACGVVTGLACSFTCKNTNIKGYPAYEITLLFLYAYGSYALAEVMKLSGIMSLFFCGITMAHYNSYNLSKESQVTAEHIFKSFALTAEFFVFLYMGMGFCAGQFGRWDVTFIILAIIFCLVSRLFNSFPFSWLANLGRTTKIPTKMQLVLWFAGLRGAIAFALSQNMPGPNQDVYVTTTLSVVVFTTLVCGGLTEPLLTYTQLKREDGTSPGSHDEEEEYGLLHETISDHTINRGPQSPGSEDDEDAPGHRYSQVTHRRPQRDLHSFWGNVDERYLKPIFGGISKQTGASANRKRHSIDAQ